MPLSTDIVIRARDEASSTIGSIGSRLQGLGKIGKNMQKLGRSMTAFAAPAVAGLGAAATAAITFEESFAGVTKVLGDADSAPGKIAALESGLRDLSTVGGIPMLPQQLANITASAAQMGIQGTENLLSFTETAAKVGTAFDVSAEQAGQMMSNLLSVTGTSVSEMGNLAGTVNFLSDNMNATATGVANVTTRIGGAARVFGLTARESAALGAAFIDLGQSPEVAGTAINSMLSRMQTASSQSSTFQKGLAGIGMSASEMEAAVRDKGIGAITDMVSRLKSLDSTAQATAISQMFGTEHFDNISSFVAGSDSLTKSLGLLNNEMASSASLNKEFSSRSATTANQLKLMGNRMNEIGISVGQAMLPSINKVLGAIAPMAERFAAFAEARPGIVQVGIAIAGIAAVAGPAVIALGAVAGAVSAIGTAFAAGGALATAAGAIGAAFAAVGAPVAIAVAAIAAIGVLAYQVHQNWSTIGPALGALFSNIGAMARAAFTTMLSTGAAAIGGLRSAFGAAAAAMMGRIAAVAARFSTWVSAAQAVASQIVGVVTGLGGRLFSAGAAMVQRLAAGITSAAGAVGSAMSAIASQVAGFFPGSPVKFGPLTAFNNPATSPTARLMGMAAAGIAANPIGGAMQAAIAPAAAPAPPLPLSPTGGGAGGGNSYSFDVNIQVQGGATNDETAASLEDRLREVLPRLLADHESDRARLSYL